MLRHLRPTDTAGLLLFRRCAGPAQAYTLARALEAGTPRFSTRRYIGLALSPRAWRECWVEGSAGKVSSLLRIGPRYGSNVWEIRDYYLGDTRDPAAVLEEAAAVAAGAGALRVFLRVRANSPLNREARAAGFASIHTETVFRSAPDRPVRRPAPLADSLARLGMRPRAASDDAGLFRLYCSVTPVNVRAQIAMTATEWRHGQESPSRATREWVAEERGRIQAWVRTARTGAGRYVSLSAAADWMARVPEVIAAVLREPERQLTVVLVPSYDIGLRANLSRFGFAEERTFEVMAQSVAKRVEDPRVAMAAAG